MQPRSTQTEASKASAESHPLFERFGSLIPVEDLTDVSDSGHESVLYQSFGDGNLCDIARALSRERKGHAIVTGDCGVGKSTLVRRFAADVGRGRFPHLSGRRFVRLDVSNVGPEDSRACLEMIVSSFTSGEPWIVCLDGMAALFARPGGGTNKPLLRTLLNLVGPRIIGIMNDWEYAEQIGCDAQMLPLVSRIRLAEPSDEQARAIARCAARNLETRSGVNIGQNVVDRAVTLASTFMLNQRHPSKGISVVWHACENRAYERSLSNGTQATLGEEKLPCGFTDYSDQRALRATVACPPRARKKEWAGSGEAKGARVSALSIKRVVIANLV